MYILCNVILCTNKMNEKKTGYCLVFFYYGEKGDIIRTELKNNRMREMSGEMKYKNTILGIFESRPNRFIAKVWVDGKLETVHVKNTGRCTGLLYSGVPVVLEVSDNPSRKTKYDLIAVKNETLGWVNIDSQAPNKVMAEWLANQNCDYIKPEYKYGDSRIDFYVEKDNKKHLIEVKGCTLAIDGVGYFPDAPTERGVKHMRELIGAKKKGYECAIAFVIQMQGITEVRPHGEIHREFEEVFREAQREGVKIWCLPCEVAEDELAISSGNNFISWLP